jgi:hypothetical protein
MDRLWESRHIAITSAAVPLAALAIAAFGGGSDTPRPAKAVSDRPRPVGLESAGGLGKLLADSHVRTLHLFREDAGGRSSCAAALQVLYNGRPLYRYMAATRASSPRPEGLRRLQAAVRLLLEQVHGPRSREGRPQGRGRLEVDHGCHERHPTLRGSIDRWNSGSR